MPANPTVALNFRKAPPFKAIYMYQLYVGNKNYSSWSMRPWVLMTQAGIPFEEKMVRFDSFAPESAFKKTLTPLSPTGKVPLLVDGNLAIWDTLSIAEYLAERHPEKALWPKGAAERAQARSVCAEMHSGFGALRSHCPMNIEARLPDVGALLWRDQPAVRHDLQRLITMWATLLDAHGGPMLFGEFGIADAYFAPVAQRITTYALPVPQQIGDYIVRLQSLPGVAAWIDGALAENDFLDFEEPYRVR